MIAKTLSWLQAAALAATLGLATVGPVAAQFDLKLNLQLPFRLPTGLNLDFAQAGECWSNRDIQAAVVAGRILPLANILADTGVGRNAQVLSAHVCLTAQGPVYYVSILGPAGQARNIALNAADGSPYSGQ